MPEKECVNMDKMGNQGGGGQYREQRLFYIAAILYCILWFALPFFVQNNLRPDSVEQFFIGKEWSVSTTKHPTLPAALLDTAFFLTGKSPWCTYLVSSLAVFVMIWSIWQISKNFLSPSLALLAAFASCNYRYLNIGSTYFHNSVAILPFWTLTVLLFYHALKTGKRRFWILAGITAGLGLMCKYPMILLAVTCFLFVLLFKETRKYWKELFLTTIIAFLIFLPHLYWNFLRGFPTLQYMNHKGSIANPSMFDHVISPALFLGAQLALLLPVVISIFPVLNRNAAAIERRMIETVRPARGWEHWFLAFIVLVPVLLQVSHSVFTGHRMPSRFGTHLWLFFAPCVLYYLPITLEQINLRRAFRNTVIVMLITAAIFAGYWTVQPFVSSKTNDTLFPGRQLAEKVEHTWHEKFSVPIPYAAGEWKLAGNVALYGKDRPTVLAFGGNDNFGIGTETITPWVEPNDVREHGGVILWQIREEQHPVPASLSVDYPSAEVLASFEIYPQTLAKKPPIKIGIAVIPPK